MTKCTILIPVCHEFDFLRIGISKIKEHRHPEIEHEIIVADQTPPEMSQRIHDLYANDPEVRVIKMPRVDAGYPIDVGARAATGEYFCSLDADAFPINKNWLYLPIKMIEKYGFSFVGKQTGLHMAYTAQGNFFHINNYFRVSKTSLARQISNDVGFMRYENRHKAKFTPAVNTNWNISCDNGVVAQWYSDVHLKAGPKFSFALNKIIGMTNEMGVYGMVVDDLIFHMVFGFGEEWISDMNKTLGPQYLVWREKMRNGKIEEVVDEMLASLKPHHPIETNREYWDGTKSVCLSPEDEMYQYIEQLKHS